MRVPTAVVRGVRTPSVMVLADVSTPTPALSEPLLLLAQPASRRPNIATNTDARARARAGDAIFVAMCDSSSLSATDQSGTSGVRCRLGQRLGGLTSFCTATYRETR